MCGIAGIVSLRPIGNIDAILRRMLAAQAHRGPDDEGIRIFNPGCPDQSPCVALGNRRLAIIDLSPAGHQPMASADGRIYVTFNGEIYNFRELRKELEADGCRFESNSDTEVLVHGYREWGVEKLLIRLNGMFAFAIWDDSAEVMVLARDRLGEKPLYYFWDGRRLLFASEIKSILAAGLVDRSIEPGAVRAYLTFGSVPAPMTMVRGISAMPAGTSLTLRGGAPQLRRYWQLSFDVDHGMSEARALEGLRSLLDDSVRARLMTDVPLGVFLSGGLDSSTIVALMRSASPAARIRTFTAIFREPGFSEQAYARQIAQRFETDHTEREISADEVRSELPRISQTMDQPTIDGINTYFISKVTRESGTVVALCGTGADELLGGYRTFSDVARLSRAWSLIGGIPAGVALTAGILRRVSGDRRITKLTAQLRQQYSPEASYLAVRGLILGDQLDRLIPRKAETATDGFDAVKYLRQLSNGRADDIRNRVSMLELSAYLHNQLLRDTDVMSMAHSLEVRVPFLDHRLVEFVARIPPAIKFAGPPKSLLRKVMATQLPVDIISRSKRGFLFPIERWLRQEWRAIAADVCNSSTPGGLVDRNGAAALWRDFLQGRAHWAQVWALVALQRWYEDSFCGAAMPGQVPLVVASGHCTTAGHSESADAPAGTTRGQCEATSFNEASAKKEDAVQPSIARSAKSRNAQQTLTLAGPTASPFSRSAFSAQIPNGAARKTKFAASVRSWRPGHAFGLPVRFSALRRARVAGVLYLLVNGFLEAARRCLWPRLRPLNADRVCIYRIGNIGDIVCAIPAMYRIRQAYPNAHLTLVTSPGKRGAPGATEVLEKAPWLDDIVVYYSDDIGSFGKSLVFVRELRHKKFDIWFALPSSLERTRTGLRNMLTARIAGARWGFGWQISTIRWAAQAQSEVFQYPNEVQRLIDLVAGSGIDADHVEFPLGFSDESRARVSVLIPPDGSSARPLIAIAPGAKRPTNLWPAERFIEVGCYLSAKGFRIVVLGGPTDAELCSRVAGSIGAGSISVAGHTSILDSCEILKQCRIAICNDSGLQHLAAAVGTPTVSIFSGRDSPDKWYPYGTQNLVLRKWVECHTCYFELCPNGNRCINSISTESVNQAAAELIGSSVA